MSGHKTVLTILAFFTQVIASLLFVFLSHSIIGTTFGEESVYIITIGALITLMDFGLKTIYQRVYQHSSNDALQILLFFQEVIFLGLFVVLLIDSIFLTNFLEFYSFIFRTIFFFKSAQFLSDAEIIKEKYLRILVNSCSIFIFFVLLKFGYTNHPFVWSNSIFLIFGLTYTKFRFNFLSNASFILKKYFRDIGNYLFSLFPAFFFISLPLIMSKGYLPADQYIMLGYMYQIVNGAVAVSTLPTITLIKEYAKFPIGFDSANLIFTNQKTSLILFITSFIIAWCVMRFFFQNQMKISEYYFFLFFLFGIFESNQKVWMFANIQKGIMGFPAHFYSAVALQFVSLFILRDNYPMIAIIVAIIIHVMVINIILPGVKYINANFWKTSVFFMSLSLGLFIADYFAILLILYCSVTFYYTLSEFYANRNSYSG